MRNLFALLALAFMLQNAVATPKAPVFIPQGEGKVSLAGMIEYLDDPAGEFSIDQVATEKSDQFRLLDRSKKLAYDYKNQVLWLRVAIDTSRYKAPLFFLTYDYEHIGNLKLYYPKPGGGYQVKELDEKRPMEGREMPVREYVFEIPTPQAATPQYYYFRVDAHTRLIKVVLSWSGVNGLVETIHNHGIGYGLFFGGMLVLLLYNLSLYAVLRDRSYLYYVYYVAGFTLTFFHVYGFSNFLLTITPFGEALFAMFGYATIHAMILFARHFLLLKNSTPWIDRYLHVFQWVMVGGGVACFFMEVGQQFRYLNYLVLLVIPAIVAAGVKRWWQGYTPARFYTMGWAVFAVALALLTLRSVGYLPNNIITNNAVMVASLWEAIVFSIALAFRIKLIEREKKEVLAQERALLEERVAERTKEIATALESNRALVANASHELRTPVNSLRLLLDAAAMSGADTRDSLPKINAIAAHMSQLVENLLLLDANRQGPVQGGTIQDFDLAEEIGATCKMLGPMRRGSLAEFSYDVDDCAGIAVNGDLTTLRRIVINLLSNAFKFTATGSVTLHASATQDSESGNIVCKIRVKDTGVGIAPEMRERIFDPFVTSGAHRGHTGTGLGLAISRELAHFLRGGLVLLDSAPGQGSEFQLTARFSPAVGVIGSDTDLDSGPVVVPLRKRLRILLAEDDPITAEAVQLIIRLLQHDVVHAPTYEALMAQLTESIFDFALIDQRLPGGNGLDAISLCKHNKNLTGTRIVLMTADATLEVIESAKLVCHEVITKPTTAHRLRQLLGEGAPPVDLENNDLVDPTPLMQLHRSGAQPANLRKISSMFYDNVAQTLEQIESCCGQQLADPQWQRKLHEIIHRARGACASIGAESLKNEFKHLSACTDADTVNAQLNKVEVVFAETKTAVDRLLSSFH